MNAQAQQAVSRFCTALARTDSLLASLPRLGGDEDDALDDTLPGDEPEHDPDPPPMPVRERT